MGEASSRYISLDCRLKIFSFRSLEYPHLNPTRSNIQVLVSSVVTTTKTKTTPIAITYTSTFVCRHDHEIQIHCLNLSSRQLEPYCEHKDHEMSNATRCAEHVKSTCSDSLRFVRKEKNVLLQLLRLPTPTYFYYNYIYQIRQKREERNHAVCISAYLLGIGVFCIGSFGDRQHRKLFGIGSFEQLVTAPCPPLAGQ